MTGRSMASEYSCCYCRQAVGDLSVRVVEHPTATVPLAVGACLRCARWRWPWPPRRSLGGVVWFSDDELRYETVFETIGEASGGYDVGRP